VRISQPFNRDAGLASDMGRELGLPALTHRIVSTTLRALSVAFVLVIMEMYMYI